MLTDVILLVGLRGVAPANCVAAQADLERMSLRGRPSSSSGRKHESFRPVWP